MECRNCGQRIASERVELGYDYCTQEACQRACVERVPLVRVTVNKAADQFVRAESSSAPRARERSYSAVAVAKTDMPAAKQQGAMPATKQRVASELQVLRQHEARLDRELDAADRRFLGGELTAAEMKRVQNAAIDRFNAKVTAANIRYRSLKRQRV